MKSVAFHNLGCKVNSYEIEVMQQKLQESGYKIVPFDSKADVYIVNTCTVTNIADQKSRQMLHRAKHMNPDAVVVAAGCYVQTGEEQLRNDPFVDLAIGNNRKKDVAEILEAFLRERKNRAAGYYGCERIDIGHTDEYEEMKLERTDGHTRASIKIQDGCNQFCSYCIIPFARGRARSRREEDVLAEIRGLAANGYKEVVLTGIHISSYGLDFNGKSDLLSLLEKTAGIEGIKRVRLGSLEPRIISEEFAERLHAIPGFCPHFHLSLQSGCDETLRRMNRHYTTGEYYERVKLLRRIFDNPAITTDVIVGFPQETEKEFEETCAFLEQARFFEMHVFKYSRRKGTAADKLSGQIPATVKAARSARLLAMEAAHSRAYRESYIGEETEILLEERKKIGGRHYWIGHTKTYVRGALEAFDLAQNRQNRLVRGVATGFLTDEIVLLEEMH